MVSLEDEGDAIAVFVVEPGGCGATSGKTFPGFKDAVQCLKSLGIREEKIPHERNATIDLDGISVDALRSNGLIS